MPDLLQCGTEGKNRQTVTFLYLLATTGNKVQLIISLKFPSRNFLNDNKWWRPFNGRAMFATDVSGGWTNFCIDTEGGVCVAFDPLYDLTIYFWRAGVFPCCSYWSSHSSHCESPDTGRENSTSVFFDWHSKSRIVLVSLHMFKMTGTSEMRP